MQTIDKFFLVGLIIYGVTLIAFFILLRHRVQNQSKRISFYFLFIMVALVILLQRASLSLPDISILNSLWYPDNPSDAASQEKILIYLQMYNLALVETIRAVNQLIFTLLLWAVLSGIPLFILILSGHSYVVQPPVDAQGVITSKPSEKKAKTSSSTSKVSTKGKSGVSSKKKK